MDGLSTPLKLPEVGDLQPLGASSSPNDPLQQDVEATLTRCSRGVTDDNLPGEWDTGPVAGKEVSVSRKAAYVPERGDAMWITLDPQANG